MRHFLASLIRFAGATVRPPPLAFAIIFLLSFSIRTTLLMKTKPSQVIAVDEGEAGRIARSLARAGTFSDPYVEPTGATAHSPPFYSLLVSVIFRAFGTGVAGSYARCIASILAYSVLFGLQPYFARRLGFPPTAGFIAGLFSAAIPLNRSAEVFMGLEDPYSAIALACLILFSLAIWNNCRRAPVWVCHGMSWGLALHISPSLLPIFFGTGMVHVVLFSPASRLRVARLWIFSLIAAAITLMPWTVRNHRRLGGWFYMRSNFGLEFYLANQDDSSPSLEQNVATGWYQRTSPDVSRDAARWVRANGELAFNRRLLRKATAWVSEHPGRFVALTGERVLYFWFGPFEHAPFAIVNSAITLLGLIAIGMMKQRIGETQFWLFVMTLAMYPLVYYFVQYDSRYRAPIRWILILTVCWLAYEFVLRSTSPKFSAAGNTVRNLELESLT